MRTNYTLSSKIVSIVVCLMLIISCVPVAFSAIAATPDTRVVDESTIDGWKDYFGEDVTATDNAGRIWTDKSVFKDASQFTGVNMQDKDNNFLVALSAIAANKSITGYSHIPTDTMLVLDVSGSMNSSNNNAVDDLIKAANNAITKLQAVNNHNRVGIVMYSGNYTTNSTADDGDAVLLLPLDRYTHSSNTFLVKDSNTVNVSGQNTRTETIKVNTNVTGKEHGAVNSSYEKDVLGGTYIQAGTYKAMQEFLSQEETEITEDTFQKGTKRMPIMVLMSDGVPTIATNNYMGNDGGVGTSKFGDGSESTLNNSEYLSSAIPFAAQLSASYAKERIEEKYGRDSLFYTLGFKVDNSAVLDPSKNTTAINNHWNTYNALSSGGSMQLAIGERWVSTGYNRGYYQTIYQSIEKSTYDLSKDYVTEYFNDESLLTAFDKIVEQIILQSLYYPTYVEGSDNNLGGYVEFHDDLGSYMDVKDIKGIMIGDHLYTGEVLASNFSGGSLGTIDAPTDLGDNMIWAVKERLGISDTPTAQNLVQDAYADGQLAYNAQTGEYSNYIAWYADANGNFMAFADKDDTEPLQGATYLNKSYGYLGEVIDGHKKADMMYVSVQVHERLSDGLIGIKFRVPASLIPVVSYNITLTGESLDNPGDITLEYDNQMEIDTNGDGIADTTRDVSPIRLVYEAGLRDEINELTVADIVADDYEYEQDGVYTFYTNHWDLSTIDSDNHIETVNTVVTYSPSVENENYYYTQDSTVYVLDGEDYVPYTGATAPVFGAQTYYRAYQVFELSDEVSAGNAIMHTHYEAISQASLEVAQADDDRPTTATQWHIPMGTIHKMLEPYSVSKNDNLTGTVPYVHYPDIQHIGDDPSTQEDEGAYFTEDIHGNNGLLTLTAAQGIKITKEVDETLATADNTYTFTVEALTQLPSGDEFRVKIFDKDGNEQAGDVVSFDSDNKLEIGLKAGETAYLIDLPTGAQFNVSEATAPEYKLVSINGQDIDSLDVTVEQGVITGAQFLNTTPPPDTDGALVLAKQVDHPFAQDYLENLDNEPVFTFNVTIGDDDPVEYTLKDNETVTIEPIPLGTEVTIVEDMTGLEGFVSNYPDNTHTFTMETNEYHIVTFTNTYEPQGIYPNITVTGDKTFTGREDDEWLDTDEFTFKLEKWVNNEWVELATATATKDNPTFDFSDIIGAEFYDHVGTHSYRISEVYTENPYLGITYDKGVRWFDVVVADNDMDGYYEVSTVNGYQGAEVTESEGEFNVHSEFTNTYAPTGSDAVTIVVNKSIDDKSVEDQNDSTQSNSGYLFGLYQGDELVQEFPPTAGESGETMLTLTFGAQDIGKFISYTLKEIVPDTPQSGITYSDKEYTVEVLVEDDTMGGVTAQVAIVENVDAGPIDIGEQVTIGFTNTYDPTDDDITFIGTKTLEGRGIVDGEFTFELYSYDTATQQRTLVESVTNTGNDFAFSAITYDTVGTYRYIIKEQPGTDTTITYDSTEYFVTVTVTDEGGALLATADIGNEATAGIEFTNTYTAPTEPPTEAPTQAPTQAPTVAPTEPTEEPTQAPTVAPTEPTEAPTQAPTQPTDAPVEDDEQPTEKPTKPAGGSNQSSTSPQTGATTAPLILLAALMLGVLIIGKSSYELKKPQGKHFR